MKKAFGCLCAFALVLACSAVSGGEPRTELAAAQQGKAKARTIGDTQPPGKSKGNDDVKPRALNPPVTLNTRIGDPSKKTVVIYYANENAPTAAEAKNYKTIISWLRSSKNKEVHKIADHYENDLKRFPKAVDADIAALKKNAVKSKSPVSVVVFTNRLARKGQFLVLHAGAKDYETKEFTLPKLPTHFIIAANPLMLPDSLRAALITVSKQFSPDKHQYVLITKSHGSSGNAMTILNNVDASKISQKRYVASAEKAALQLAKLSTKPSGQLGADPILELGVDPINELGAFGQVGLGAEGQVMIGLKKKGRQTRIGTSKADYLATLKTVGAQTQMTFPLLFAESCQSYFSKVALGRMRKLGSNVGRLYTSDVTGLKYNTVDYAAVFKEAAEAPSFADAMHRVLYREYQRQKAAKSKAKSEGLDLKTSSYNGIRMGTSLKKVKRELKKQGIRVIFERPFGGNGKIVATVTGMNFRFTSKGKLYQMYALKPVKIQGGLKLGESKIKECEAFLNTRSKRTRAPNGKDFFYKIDRESAEILLIARSDDPNVVFSIMVTAKRTD